MAKFRPVYPTMWRDPEFMNLAPKDKTLFVYLCTNSTVNESGIYQLSLKIASIESGLETKYIEDALVSGRIKNVLYDPKANYVFVKNTHKYHKLAGGRPDLLKQAIINEFNISSACPFWENFVEIYPEYNVIFKLRLKNVVPTLGERSNLEILPTWDYTKLLPPGYNLRPPFPFKNAKGEYDFMAVDKQGKHIPLPPLPSKDREYIPVIMLTSRSAPKGERYADLMLDVSPSLFFRAYAEGFIRETDEYIRGETTDETEFYYFHDSIPAYIREAISP